MDSNNSPTPTNGQLPPNRLAVYATLQSLTLIGSWIIFVALWTYALFNYDMNNIEWWLLVGVACMGVYGLRPSLERAIDTAWLGDSKNSQALAERVAQLRPIKRRIDILFSIGVVALFLVGVVIWAALIAFNVITPEF
jgi:membrane protein required for beta-lactamase induction